MVYNVYIIHLEVFIFILILGVALFIATKNAHRFGLKKIDLIVGLGIKTLASVVFVLIFTYYYNDGHLSGDAREFLKDGKVLHDLALFHPSVYLQLLFGFGELSPVDFGHVLEQTNIWTTSNNGDLINDNRLIIRINSLIHFFSFGSSYVHALVFALISFLGSLLIFKSLHEIISKQRLFYFVLIGFPSIAFWSSGISKEAILVFAIGLFFFGLRKLKNKSLGAVVFFIIGALILCWNKPYVGLVLIACSSIFLFGKLFQFNINGIRLFLGLAVVTGIGLCYAPSSVNLIEKISYKQKDLNNLGRGGVFFVTDSSFCAFDHDYIQHFEISQDSVNVKTATSGEYKLFGQSEFHEFVMPAGVNNYEKYLVQPKSKSFIETIPIDYSGLNLVLAIPQAFINVLIRPYPWDSGSDLKIAAFISNLSLFVLLGIGFFKRRTLNPKEKYWFYYLLTSALIIIFIIGWTVPILGAIVRYKMAVDLLLITCVFILWKNQSEPQQ